MFKINYCSMISQHLSGKKTLYGLSKLTAVCKTTLAMSHRHAL